MTFGEKLQLLRKQKGLSQEKLAEQLGVSRQAVSKWEVGDSLPETENVMLLGKLLCVSIDYLLNDDIASDDDIPVVHKNTAMLQNKFHSTMLFILGAVCTAIGSIGNITIFVLSTMIKVHVEKKITLPDGSVRYYGGGDVLGYSFTGFIQEYRLQAILYILIVLIMIGIAIMVYSKGRQRNKKFIAV